MDKEKIKLIKKAFLEYEDNKKQVGKVNNLFLSEKVVDYQEEEKIKKLQKQIAMRDILYMQINEEDKEYIDLRFTEKLSVYDICSRLYISESGYYRRMRNIYKILLEHFVIFEEIFK